jgi:glutathione S-transferase
VRRRVGGTPLRKAFRSSLTPRVVVMKNKLEKYPNLSAYIARGEARPAYKCAFADQLAVFTGKPSTG